MEHHTYKTIEITGTSPTSIEGAVRNGIERCGESVKHLRWFTMTDLRGALEGGEVKEWQVSLKVSFTLEEPA
jgi:flavin-binding protein dodecin